MINGVTINFNASTDSINDILQRINNSARGRHGDLRLGERPLSADEQERGGRGHLDAGRDGQFPGGDGAFRRHVATRHEPAVQHQRRRHPTSQSNTITSATSGLTGLTVTALSTGSDHGDGRKRHVEDIRRPSRHFVNDYNAVQNYLSSQTMTTKDSTGKTVAGTLTGDMDANNLQTKLRQLTTATPGGLSGAVMNLNSLGIESNGTDNTLAISDPTTLSNALTSNLSAVKDLFTNATTGLGTTLSNYLTATTSSTGVITTKQADFTKQSSDITSTIANMETRITNDQNRMTDEFVAMETARAQINLQAQYLTSAFGGSSSSSTS